MNMDGNYTPHVKNDVYGVIFTITLSDILTIDSVDINLRIRRVMLLSFPSITDRQLLLFRKHPLQDALQTLCTSWVSPIRVSQYAQHGTWVCSRVYPSISTLFAWPSLCLSASSDPPDAPSAVRLSVSSSTSLRVDFQEPLCVNSAVVTKYKGQPLLHLHSESQCVKLWC